MVQVDGILDRVSGLAEEWKLANLQPQIAVCRNQLHARNGIDVAVFGRFKAGKSSFLNHLTGRDVLPIGVVPLTAVITRLRFGPADRAEVRFLNGTAKTIPFDDIGLYVGENENPSNTKQVASVEVELPALKALAPLQFVDTPGLGSAFTHNTEVALKWLPNVGAALVAVSSDAPLSEHDLALLEELRRHTPKIVLLLTKADLLTEAQRAEVLAFVRQQLQRKTASELPVFFYSIQPALGQLKAELESNLLMPLLRDRGQAAAAIGRHKLASLLGQTLDYLRIALAAATQAESSRRALQEKLAEERREFEAFREELHVLAREWDAKAFEWSVEQLQPRQHALQQKATLALQALFPTWRLRLPGFVEAYRQWTGNFLSGELRLVSEAERGMFCEPIQRVRLHVERLLRGMQDRLAQHVKDAFGLAVTRHEFLFEVSEPTAPPVDIGMAFDVTIDLFGYLVPMALFRRPVERRLLRQARWEVEKNLSRLAADWRDRVSVAIQELRVQAEQHAQNELKALEQMVEQTQSKAPQLKEGIDELERCQSWLRAD
jgi:GTP-binding protein EngB required for normal cell division